MTEQRNTETLYAEWHLRATADPDLIPELDAMSADGKQDAFWRDLDFGTAGLRGVIGAGTNRMNVYTVSAAARGLAEFVLTKKREGACAAVSYDTRIKSRLFAEATAATMAACGIKVWIYREPMPVPCLSYAVRQLGCETGVMITASHNPSKYNGFKAYDSEGCQLREEDSAEVSGIIRQLDIFDVTNHKTFEELLAEGTIEYIPETLCDSFRAEIRKLSCLGPDDTADRNVSIVYSPLCGTGLVPVTKVLGEAGYTNITVVEEQRKPDGNFPTCPYPNPEKREALALGLEYAERLGADLMLATDPDCDRVGIAVKKPGGEYVLLSGNQTGVLLLDYICMQKAKQGKLSPDSVFVKSFVSTKLTEKVAAKYGAGCVNTLTGFKYIGNEVSRLVAEGKPEAYLFGFEESYGYLTGTHVREKDGVNAAFLICEMFSFWKAKGKGLYERLQEIYSELGYLENVTVSFTFEGEAGFNTMRAIMQKFHAGLSDIGGVRVVATKDYLAGVGRLPKADVLEYELDDGCTVIIRPSGTEPQLKAYLGVPAESKDAAAPKFEKLKAAIGSMMK